MTTAESPSGTDLRNLHEDRSFLARPQRSGSGPVHEAQALRQIARALAGSPPEVVLQELVDIAVRFCNADSSGISLQEQGPDGQQRFRWIVVSGSFNRYLNGTTPRTYSPCGTCLDRDQPQLYTVSQPYYDFLGVEARDITEGILIPWKANHERGTLWAVSHSPGQTFTRDDYELLNTLADFASIAVEYRRQQQLMQDSRDKKAMADKAHELAHQINNPLQSVTNSIYLAQHGGADVQQHLGQAAEDLRDLSKLVGQLLQFGR